MVMSIIMERDISHQEQLHNLEADELVSSNLKAIEDLVVDGPHDRVENLSLVPKSRLDKSQQLINPNDSRQLADQIINGVIIHLKLESKIHRAETRVLEDSETIRWRFYDVGSGWIFLTETRQKHPKQGDLGISLTVDKRAPEYVDSLSIKPQPKKIDKYSNPKKYLSKLSDLGKAAVHPFLASGANIKWGNPDKKS